MPRLKEDMRWFKTQFKRDIEAGIRDTPFSLDMATAIATQETRYVWSSLYPRMTVAEMLKLCVGDTIDAPGRKAFPRTKAALLREPKGDRMFTIAREALASIAPTSASYRRALRNPDKFCHGFGIFQYDLQHFKTNPAFFLEKKWYDFGECLKLLVNELKEALKSAYGPRKRVLTDEEKVYVAIAYNAGSVNIHRSFKQGHKDSDGKYYGEYIWQYLQLAKTIT